MPGEPTTRRLRLGLGLGLLGLGAVVFWMARGGGATSTPAEPPAAPPVSAAAPASATAGAATLAKRSMPVKGIVGPGGDLERVELDPDLDPRAIIEGGSHRALAEAGQSRVDELASIYRDRAAFPPWSYVVPAGRDPVAEAARAPKTTVPLSGGRKLVVTLSSWSLVPEETLAVSVALLDEDDRPLKASSGRASLLNTAETGYLAHLDLAPAKASSPASTGTPVLGSWKVPPADQVAGDPGVHRLQLIVTAPNGEKLEAQTDVLIAVPGFRLTRHYRDRVVDGNLVVEIEVNATRRLRAHVAALLGPAGAAGGERAYAQRAAVVEAGTSTIDLVFYGRALHELGAAGPYRITSLVAQDTSTFPPARLPLQRDVYTTAGYPLSAFSNAAFGQQDLLELADYLETR